MSLHVTITNRTKHRVNTRWLKQHALATLQLLHVKNAEWSITIVGDKEMAALHEQTLQLPTTTDVLTFDLRDDIPRKTPEGAAVELDTVICHDEAARRATDFAHPVQHELLLYCVHSLLHVQGYDDISATKAARMHRREDMLLTALGIGALYAPDRRPTPAKPSSRGARKQP